MRFGVEKGIDFGVVSIVRPAVCLSSLVSPLPLALVIHFSPTASPSKASVSVDASGEADLLSPGFLLPQRSQIAGVDVERQMRSSLPEHRDLTSRCGGGGALDRLRTADNAARQESGGTHCVYFL